VPQFFLMFDEWGVRTLSMKRFISIGAIFSLLVCAQSFAALQFDPNVQPELKNQILDDFAFIKSIRSLNASPLHRQVFGDVDGTNYFSWFNLRVFQVGLDSCGSPSAVACVIVMYPNKIWMTQNYTRFSHPQIARLSVIYHEARHTETDHGNWSHANCPIPFKDSQGRDVRSIWTGTQLEGHPACDQTAYGSYGSATIFLKNVAKYCSNCSEKVKADADLYGTDQLERIIDPTSKKNMILDFASSRISI
jgi:hypothetical protein